MTKVSCHIGGKGPNHGGGQSKSKRLMYEDLNAPQSSNWSPLFDFVIRLGFEGLSLDLKQTKCAVANKKNPNWPLREYTHFARPIAIKNYIHMSLKMLKHEFLGTNTDGYMELCKDLCWELMRKFDAFEKCNNYLDY
jgi:hypothetical protein